MRIGDGPAAVTGTNVAKRHWLYCWEGATSRINRKSEDLPETPLFSRKREQLRCEDKTRESPSQDYLDSGFFLNTLLSKNTYIFNIIRLILSLRAVLR